jgi:Holliday junction resolvase RusA-like endonuclease
MTRYGRAYTPKATHIFENAVADGWNKNYWYGDSPIAIQIVLDKDTFTVTISEYKASTPTSPLRGDIDNYAKSILDGLNGVAFKDDSQVRSLEVTKL